MKPEVLNESVSLYHGDCLEVMRSLADGSFDVIITSPPYNLGNTTGGGFPAFGHYKSDDGLGKRGGGGKWSKASAAGGLAHGYGAYDDAMPHEEYVAWQKDCLLEMWRLLSDTGAIFYNHKSRLFSGRLATPLEYNPDLPVRRIVIWARAGGINFAPTHYVPTHEWIVIFAKDGFRLKSKGASGVGDVWSIPQVSYPDHPAPFPLAIPRRILETTGAKRILDPFGGSGTTGMAAMHEGASAVLIEKNDAYCDVIRKRIAEADICKSGSLFAGSRDLFAEMDAV